MGIVAMAVSLYGAFVFQRSVSVTGRWEDKSASVGTGEALLRQDLTAEKRQAP